MLFKMLVSLLLENKCEKVGYEYESIIDEKINRSINNINN